MDTARRRLCTHGAHILCIAKHSPMLVKWCAHSHGVPRLVHAFFADSAPSASTLLLPLHSAPQSLERTLPLRSACAHYSLLFSLCSRTCMALHACLQSHGVTRLSAHCHLCPYPALPSRCAAASPLHPFLGIPAVMLQLPKRSAGAVHGIQPASCALPQAARLSRTVC